MKYAFIGTHGCGKSAGAHFLAAKLKKENPHLSIKVLEESVREISKLVGINNPTFQKLTILDSLYKQELYSSMYDVVICDRTPFDYLLYGKFFGVELDPIYEKLAIENLRTFNAVYFVRSDGTPIADDNFRLTDRREQIKIDLTFDFHLKLNEIFVIEKGTKEIYE